MDNLKRRIRTGRPRTNQERYASGRSKPITSEDLRLPNLWQRIKQHGVQAGIDPRMGSEIGRLCLFGHLTGTDFEAANRFAFVVGRWEALNGMPRRSVASPSYSSGRGLDTSGDPSPDVVDEVRESYYRMVAVIPSQPIHIKAMLENVCVDDLMCPEQHYQDLHRLLQRLATLWGIRE